MRLRNANVVKWAFWEFLLNACHTVMYYIIVVGKRPNILSIPGLQKIDFLSHTKKTFIDPSPEGRTPGCAVSVLPSGGHLWPVVLSFG